MRDKLDDDALAARKAGLRYGDYMAVKEALKREPPAQGKPKRLCVVCGGVLTRNKQLKYCSDECRKREEKRRKSARDG